MRCDLLQGAVVNRLAAKQPHGAGEPLDSSPTLLAGNGKKLAFDSHWTRGFIPWTKRPMIDGDQPLERLVQRSFSIHIEATSKEMFDVHMQATRRLGSGR